MPEKLYILSLILQALNVVILPLAYAIYKKLDDHGTRLTRIETVHEVKGCGP